MTPIERSCAAPGRDRAGLPVFLAVLTACSLLPSCSTFRGHDRSSAELEQELDSNPLVTQSYIADLQATRPQLTYPFRLGIAPPIVHQETHTELAYHHRTRDVWDAQEEEVIGTWVERFRAAGLVGDVVFLPQILIENEAGVNATPLERIRAAAARQGVDAVLVTRSVSSVSSRSYPLAVLDLTIVAGLVLPSHAVESRTVIEAVLVDVRNEYVYLAGRGTGEAARSAPLFLIPEKARPLVDQGHLAALEDLSQDLMDRTVDAGFERLSAGSRSSAAP